jgi:hypothetical protein
MPTPTYSTTIPRETVTAIFMDPESRGAVLVRKYGVSLSVIRSIRSRRTHRSTTRDLVSPRHGRAPLDAEAINMIRASTDSVRVTASRVGCSISSVSRHRPTRNRKSATPD